MSEWIVPVVVALISGPVMLLLRRLDRRNTDQHAESLDTLKRIEGKVDQVSGDLIDHLKWHLDDDD